MGKRPDFRICHQETGKDKDGNEKSYYTKVGVAWMNETQAGKQTLSLKLDYLPLGHDWDRELVGFEFDDQEEKEPVKVEKVA